jgi:hypothetical protein
LAVYDVLEKHGLKVFLVNARHTKNLPERKSDVQESQWLMKLHTYGLLRNSFRPPEEIRVPDVFACASCIVGSQFVLARGLEFSCAAC